MGAGPAFTIRHHRGGARVISMRLESLAGGAMQSVTTGVQDLPVRQTFASREEALTGAVAL